MPLRSWTTMGYLHPFWDGSRFWYGVGEKPRTVIELAMCNLSAELRSSDTWWTDHLDERIREGWLARHAGRSRAIETPSGMMDIVLSAQQVEYVIDELAGYAALRDEENNCQVSCFERIWESNGLLDQDLRSSIDRELSPLRLASANTTEDATSLDIIDPYSYPVVYARTLTCSSDGKFYPVFHPTPPPSDSYTLSTRFSCLPAAFSIAEPGKPVQAQALSYINNIHPALTSLYGHIETTLARSIPLFEHVLTDLHRDNPLPQRITGSCKYTEWDEPEEPEHSDDEDGWANYESEMRSWVLQRPISIPDVPVTGYPGGLESRRTIVTLRGRTVKVLIRATDIKLEPGGPHFPGSPWHVEGMRNEHIAACIVQCIHNDNITPTTIGFRMSICSPVKFTPGDEGATGRTWGLLDGSPGNQKLGKVQLTPGRSIAFPNLYQHRFHAAHLVDPTRSGRMTLLSLFLVDPELADAEKGPDFEILSTSSVPPQQKVWARHAVEESLDIRIPNEIVDKILNSVDGLISEKDNIAYVTEMKRERERFRISHDRYWFSLPFDLWSGEGPL